MFQALYKIPALALCVTSLCAAAPGIWLDVPFVRQKKDGCGAASISMVIQYWNKQGDPALAARADPPAIQDALYSRDAHGIFASGMERYFEESGFRTYAFKGDWADLKRHLSKGRPLIVCLKEAGRGGPLHYVVVAGLDWQENVAFLNDPARRKLLRVDRASFEKSWRAAGNWTLLALPEQDK
jgi:predicted double-glycine peptidase